MLTKDAMLYETLQDRAVHCYLCNHHCRVKDGEAGFCDVRVNRAGKLKTLAYGKVVAANSDPIEKKPLYHFLPGSMSFSIATMGCNFHCGFCQNWQISQIEKKGIPELPGQTMSPEKIVEAAQKSGCSSIAYTYTEPTIFFEYAYDTAKLAKNTGIANVFVTNGFMNRQALDTISPYLDACNVDLKSFDREFYKSACQGRLQPVLDSITGMKALDIWVEVSTLVIPGRNDSDGELQHIARFIAGVSPEIPWHISRCHPGYHYGDTIPTPHETLRKAYRFGKEAGLQFVYVGNMPGEEKDTFCPSCSHPLIKRRGHFASKSSISNSRCPECDSTVPGIFQS